MSKLIEKILKESEEKIVYTGINNLNNELDLNSIDSVKNFCIKHAPKKFFKNGKLKMDKVEVGGDLYTIQELIEFMMDQYNIASDSEEIEIYRSLNLKNIKEINFKNLGESWTFIENCAVSYNSHENGNNYILTGLINYKNINWEDSFIMYLENGPSESECCPKKGSNINITNINNKQVDIKGII